MKTITVKTQADLDAIVDNFEGLIKIVGEKINVSKRYPQATVEARGQATVAARDQATVRAWGQATVEALDQATVRAWGQATVEARGQATVEAWDQATVEVWDQAKVEVRDQATVEAWGQATVRARDQATVEAWGQATVRAGGQATVEARDQATVRAWDQATVRAWGQATVRVWDQATVDLKGFAQAGIFSKGVKIKTSGMARVIRPNEDILDFALYHSLVTKRSNILFFKAVKPDMCSFYDARFQYSIGKTLKHSCDPSTEKNCADGIHVSTLEWAKVFGRETCDGKDEFLILECSVPVKSIVLPENSDGKVRTSKLKVLRIVPKEEW